MRRVRAFHWRRGNKLKTAGFSLGWSTNHKQKCWLFWATSSRCHHQKAWVLFPTQLILWVPKHHGSWFQEVRDMLMAAGKQKTWVLLPHTVRLLNQSGCHVDETKSNLQNQGQEILCPHVTLASETFYCWHWPFPQKTTTKCPVCLQHKLKKSYISIKFK